MKTSSNPSNAQIVVFGLDQTGKPQAGRFLAQHAETARQAAASLKLRVREVSSDLKETASKVPVGRIHARGKAFIPYVKRELYDKLCETLQGAPVQDQPASADSAAPPIEQSLNAAKAALSSVLPANWEAIKPGHLVLLQESLPDGWYEAIVLARENEMLTLRFRDHPKYPTYVRHIRSVALVYPGLT